MVNVLDGGLTGKACENSALLPFVKGTAPDYHSTCRANNSLEKGLNWLQKLSQ